MVDTKRNVCMCIYICIHRLGEKEEKRQRDSEMKTERRTTDRRRDTKIKRDGSRERGI